MFTGLIQETGSVLSVEPGEGTTRIAVAAPTLAARLHTGDSIAVSGVCLTALAVDTSPGPGGRFEADLAEETIRRTSLGRLAAGAVVNLELPTPAGTPLGGHVVQGHVDGVGRLVELRAITPGRESTDWWLEIEVPPAVAPYVVEKGSLAIEGISLTIARWDGQRVGVAIIPHTYRSTNLREHKPGDLLNLEADVLLRHAVQNRAHETSAPLTLAFLIANGY